MVTHVYKVGVWGERGWWAGGKICQFDKSDCSMGGGRDRSVATNDPGSLCRAPPSSALHRRTWPNTEVEVAGHFSDTSTYESIIIT